MYYCYILQSEKDKKLYIGYTEDLKKRLEKHNSGEVKATNPRIPFKLIFYSAFKNKYDAIDAERYFKSSFPCHTPIIARKLPQRRGLSNLPFSFRSSGQSISPNRENINNPKTF